MVTKKVLAIIGSPKKKGQTIEQLNIFEQCLEDHEGISVENLYLSDYDFKDCIGCNLCFDKGENHCPLKDDRDLVLSKLLAADAVIWVTPIYAMHISYLLKKCLDRFAFLCHRPAFQSKKAFILIIKGDQFRPAMDYLKTYLESWGFDCVGSIGFAPLAIMSEKNRQNKLKSVKNKSDQFISQIIQNKKRSPGIMQLLNFKMWQMRAGVKDIQNNDYKYFTENKLMQNNYFYEVKISKAKLLISASIFHLLKIYIKKEMGGFENI